MVDVKKYKYPGYHVFVNLSQNQIDQLKHYAIENHMTIREFVKEVICERISVKTTTTHEEPIGQIKLNKFFGGI
jgi:hypothetical protein